MTAGLGYGSFSSSPRNPRHSQKPSLKQFLNQLAYFANFCQFAGCSFEFLDIQGASGANCVEAGWALERTGTDQQQQFLREEGVQRKQLRRRRKQCDGFTIF